MPIISKKQASPLTKFLVNKIVDVKHLIEKDQHKFGKVLKDAVDIDEKGILEKTKGFLKKEGELASGILSTDVIPEEKIAAIAEGKFTSLPDELVKPAYQASSAHYQSANRLASKNEINNEAYRISSDVSRVFEKTESSAEIVSKINKITNGDWAYDEIVNIAKEAPEGFSGSPLIFGAKKIIQGHHENRIYDTAISELSTEMIAFYGEEATTNIVKSHNKKMQNIFKNKKFDSLAEYSNIPFSIEEKQAIHKVMESYTLGARNTMFSDVHNKFKLSGNKKYIGTTKDKISEVYATALENNMDMTANHLEKLYTHIDNGDFIEQNINKVSKMIGDLHHDLGDDGSKALRFYREHQKELKDQVFELRDDAKNFLDFTTEYGKKRLRVDHDSLALTKQAYPNVNFDYKFFEAANIENNAYAHLFVADLNATEGKIIQEELIKGLEHAKSKGWNENFVKEYFSDNLASGRVVPHGDVGRNYSAIVPTKEYIEAVKNSKNSKIQRAKAFLDNRKPDASYHKMRALDDRAVMEDVNRIMPAEEFANYAYRLKKNVYDNKARSIIKDVRKSYNLSSTTIAPSYKGVTENPAAKLSELELAINQIEDHFNKSVAPTSKSDSTIMNTAYGFIDFNTALALNSPRLALSNALQPFSTGAVYKGVANTAKNTIEVFYKSVLSGGSILKDLIHNKKTNYIPNMIKTLENGGEISQLKGKIARNYFTKVDPNVMQHELWESMPMLNKATTFLTSFFRLSDGVSRFVGLGAAVDLFENKVSNELYNSFKKGGVEKPKIFKKMKKLLHLDEFNNLEQTKLFKAANISKEKFCEEFVHLSVNKEMFNYSKHNKPWLIDAAKANSATSRAARFASWSMYYVPAFEGVIRSWKNGDKGPALNAFLITLGFFGGAAYVAEEGLPFVPDTAQPYIKDFARYNQGRLPVVAPALDFSEFVNRPMGGILTSSQGLAVYPIYKGMNAVSNLIGTNDKSKFDYAMQDAWKNIRSLPLYSKAREVQKILGLEDTEVGHFLD